MADDQVYPHHVEVDVSDSDDDASSSDMQTTRDVYEEIEEIETNPQAYASSSNNDATWASGNKGGQKATSSSAKSHAQRPPRTPKNLEVEVAGATEDHLFLEGTLQTPWGTRGSSINLVNSFCRLQDMVFYVYKKSSSPHPVKFIDCEKLVDIQPGSLSMNEFRLIDDNKREYKLRALTQTDFGAWVKAFQAALSRRRRADNKTVKVWFMDISNVSIIIERGVTTAEDLWWLVCEALNLSDESREAFCIWIMGADLAVQLCNDDVVTTALENWHTAYEDRYAGKLEGPPRLVFRTAPTLTLSAERNMKDPKAVHLFYLQAAYNILYQNYVIDLDMALELAGLAAQIRLGDFDHAKHRPGYIANSLRRYIPAYLQTKHRKKLGKWELLIAAKHSHNRGKALMIAEMLYLQRCRTLPYYGSIFFPTKNRDKARESGYWSQQTQGSINIGVNMEGIHICRDLKYLHSYNWRNIMHWEVEQDKYFYFSGYATKKSKSSKTKSSVHTYLLETKSAPLIKEHLQDLVYEIKRAERLVSKIRNRQEKTDVAQ